MLFKPFYTFDLVYKDSEDSLYGYELGKARERMILKNENRKTY